MAKQNTVFISYRRTNAWTAQAVYQYLDANNYDVFYDIETIQTGDWLETILSQIQARAHFIIILTPSAVQRFNDPHDIMRLEIETAIDEKRNIIPLLFEGVDFEMIDYALTGKLAILSKYNALEVPVRFFKYAMQELCLDKLNIDVDTVIHPTPDAYVENVSAIQASSHNQHIVTEAQRQAETLFEQAVNAHHDSQYQAALKSFTQAIELMPTYAEAYYRRGQTYWNLDDKSHALQDFQVAVDTDPNHPQINLMRAVLYLNLKKLTIALKEANAGVLANRELDEAYFVRAVVNAAMGHYENALMDYSRAILLNPDYVTAYNNRANAKHNLGDYHGAIEDYDRALDMNPENASAYNNRGVSKESLEDYKGALADYQQALYYNPKHQLAQTNIEIVQRKMQ